MTDFARAFDGAVWFDVLRRSDACPDVPPLTLLHAGPPFRGLPPAPVINAAVQAVLFEKWVDDEDDAREFIARNSVRLAPAQDHGVVTPLAQVVSASMPLLAVRLHNCVAFGAMLEGTSPALRFGTVAAECRRRLDSINQCVASAIAPLVRLQPVGLANVIRQAVASGEDCHARTAIANHVLISALQGLDTTIAAELLTIPAFVLPLLMAGAAAALQFHRCAIEAMGGNGIDFGVRRRGAVAWRIAPGAAPVGACFDLSQPYLPLPAVGDSVLIDFCGLGGQRDAPELRHALVEPVSGIVDPARVAAGAGVPRFNLAILDSYGNAGLIGRGCYRPPAELFED